MAQANTIQTNFTSGEVSPLLKGRVDVDRYYNGAQEIQNFVVRPQGGLTRRSGTKFINAAKNAAKACRLVSFEFSTTQAYILEFGDLYIRVYRDGGIVESAPDVPVEIVTTYAEADLSKLYFAQSADVLFICHPDYQPRQLSRTSHTVWTLSLFTALDGPYLDEHEGDNEVTVSSISDTATLTSTENDFVVGDVGKYVEYDSGSGQTTIGLVTAYTSATVITIQPLENVILELDSAVTLQSYAAPTLAASHSVFDETYINRYINIDPIAATWHKITDYDAGASAVDRNKVTIGAALTLVSLAVGGTLTLSSRTITAILTSITDIWVATDVNRPFRLRFDSQVVWAKVTTYTSATQVVVELGGPMPLKDRDGDAYKNDAKTKTWRNGAWGTATGWPSCVIFHEERLWFANNDNQTQTIWASKSGDFENFEPTESDSTVANDSGLSYTIASNRVNEIRWMDSGPSLLIGTAGGEWQLKASSISEPITPTNVSITPQTAYGSLEIQPVRIGPAVLFSQRSGVALREFVYQFESDSYQASDMNIVSEHLFKVNGTISSFAYQQAPDSIIWVVTSSGLLCSLTYIKDQSVYAWARHVVGGSFGSGNAVVESVASIPSGSSDEVWIVVKRTVNGATARYVERLEPLFRSTSSVTKDDAFFVDSGLTYSGVATTTITGLSHLEGESVAVLADGAVQPAKTVSSGTITLDTQATKIHAGLTFRSLLHTLPPEGGGNAGTAQGKTKRVHELTVRLFESIEFKHGPDLSNLRTRSFRGTDDPMDDSPSLFSGDISFKLNQSYEKAADYYVVQDAAYPLTVVAVMPEMVVHE